MSQNSPETPIIKETVLAKATLSFINEHLKDLEEVMQGWYENRDLLFGDIDPATLTPEDPNFATYQTCLRAEATLRFVQGYDEAVMIHGDEAKDLSFALEEAGEKGIPELDKLDELQTKKRFAEILATARDFDPNAATLNEILGVAKKIADGFDKENRLPMYNNVAKMANAFAGVREETVRTIIAEELAPFSPDSIPPFLKKT